MTEAWQVGGDKVLTLAEAFDVMRVFLEAYWRRGEKRSDDVAVLLGSLDSSRPYGPPLDLAMWHDWLEAANSVLESSPDRGAN